LNRNAIYSDILSLLILLRRKRDDMPRTKPKPAPKTSKPNNPGAKKPRAKGAMKTKADQRLPADTSGGFVSKQQPLPLLGDESDLAKPGALTGHVIVHGDCVAGMLALPAGSVDLVFADPPFNIGYKYDVYQDKRESEHYLDWSREWISAVYQVLKSDGALWLAIGDEYAAELKVLSQEIGFTCRSWVVWYYTFGVNCKAKFTRSHAHLFHFVKDPNKFTFLSEEPINRIPSARQLVYNDARSNPVGRLPDDTWILRPQDLQDSFTAAEDTWYFPRVAGTFKERQGFHGCQMPEQLLGRIIRLCSRPGEVVLDPFSGSGTTLAVAKKLGRASRGFDLSPDYAKYGTARLNSIHVGDPLDGTSEPTMSAPVTIKKEGKRKNAPSQKPRAASRSIECWPIRRCKRRCTRNAARAICRANRGPGIIRSCACARPGDWRIWRRASARTFPGLIATDISLASKSHCGRCMTSTGSHSMNSWRTRNWQRNSIAGAPSSLPGQRRSNIVGPRSSCGRKPMPLGSERSR